MSPNVVVRQLAVVVLGKDHNPTILNPDFLKFNDIVGPDWELAGDPVCAHTIARVAYDNGVSVTAEMNKVVFHEPFDLDGEGDVETPAIARRYIQQLPHVDYRAVGINPQGHAAFESVDEANNWFKSRFLLDGPWREYLGEPADAAVKLVYKVDEQTKLQLSITVEELTWETKHDKGVLHIVGFAGNFHHTLAGEFSKDRLSDAIAVLNRWEQDLQTYRTIVDELILGDGK